MFVVLPCVFAHVQSVCAGSHLCLKVCNIYLPVSNPSSLVSKLFHLSFTYVFAGFPSVFTGFTYRFAGFPCGFSGFPYLFCVFSYILYVFTCVFACFTMFFAGFQSFCAGFQYLFCWLLILVHCFPYVVDDLPYLTFGFISLFPLFLYFIMNASGFRMTFNCVLMKSKSCLNEAIVCQLEAVAF